MLNTSLAGIAFFMIILGAAAGFYPVSILGVFILIASVLAPSKVPGPSRKPVPQERRGFTNRITPQRVVPSASTQAQIQLPTVPQPTAQTMFPQSSNQGYASNMALFPAAMFPSASPVSPAPQPQAQKQPAVAPDSRDEVVDLAAIVVLLKLLSG